MTTEQLQARWQELSDLQDALFSGEDDGRTTAELDAENQLFVWEMVQIDIALGEEYGFDDLPSHLQHLAAF